MPPDEEWREPHGCGHGGGVFTTCVRRWVVHSSTQLQYDRGSPGEMPGLFFQRIRI